MPAAAFPAATSRGIFPAESVRFRALPKIRLIRLSPSSHPLSGLPESAMHCWIRISKHLLAEPDFDGSASAIVL